MTAATISPASAALDAKRRDEQIAFVVMVALLMVAPLAIYPFFLMQALCFALFACAFNLLIGYVGLCCRSATPCSRLGGIHFAAHGQGRHDRHRPAAPEFRPGRSGAIRRRRGLRDPASSPARWPSAARASISR